MDIKPKILVIAGLWTGASLAVFCVVNWGRVGAEINWWYFLPVGIGSATVFIILAYWILAGVCDILEKIGGVTK